MNAGAMTLVDHVLPDTPIRQWVLRLPFSWRFTLASDGELLGQVLRIFTDTVARWYRQRQADRRLPGGQCGSVTAIHRASSDLRCAPPTSTACFSTAYAEFRIGHRSHANGLRERWRSPSRNLEASRLTLTTVRKQELRCMTTPIGYSLRRRQKESLQR
jgi:hypothetical protein